MARALLPAQLPVPLPLLVALLVFAAAACASAWLLALSYFRPLAMMAWSRRIALRRAGLRKTRIGTSAGRQILWQGGAGPLLVLLHGAGDQAGSWNKVVPRLRSHFALILPDLAGHGESEPRQGPLSLGVLLGALDEALEGIPAQKLPMALAGNSLGAWVAMLYARKRPERVARVILIDGGPIRHAAELGLVPGSRAEARKVMDAVLDGGSPRPPDFVLDDLVRVSRTGPIARLLAAGEDDMANYLLEDQLAGFALPVDLIWGASDRLVPVEYAKKLQAQLPCAALWVIERCGHAPQLERPGEFASVLFEILSPKPGPAPARPPSPSAESGESP